MAMMRPLLAVLMVLAFAAGAQGEPRTVRDCPDCPDLVLVPAGSFTMGAAIGEEDAENVPFEFRGWSFPRHTVRTAEPFYLGRDHVTRGQFAAFVKATNREVAGCRGGESWRSPGFVQTDDDPVVCVSAEDADAYMQWLSGATGKAYHLPSEAEWEYAARAGTTGVRYWASDGAGACRHAATGGCGLTGTVPVGRFTSNAFGLRDMLGEAWQWTADCWNDSYDDAPADGSARLSGNCSLRVARGGAWSAALWTLRAAGRDAYRTNYRASDVGFRVARAVSP
jgi:formylglycine-generating enzyme required for sulfatase activity